MLKHYSKRRFAVIAVLLVAGIAGFCGGVVMHFPSDATAAEVRRNPPREAFLSGGERAVIVLEKMNVTLERMDKRLENIEKAVAEMKLANLEIKVQD